MDEAKNVAINLVTWNSAGFMPAFFASVDEQTYRDFTVTVVDNASDDGTLDWIRSEHPEVATLRNIKNQGFARAHNQAIALALSRWSTADIARRYILVANPDIEFAPSCVYQLVAAMEADLELAAVGPKLLKATVRYSDEGEREVERTNVIDSTGLVMSKKRLAYDRGAGEIDAGQYDAAREVFGLSGACVLFRASALVDAAIDQEWFDEDFFAFKEDVDIAWRMKRLGMKAQCIPSAIAWHHRGTPSAPHASWISLFRQRRNKPVYVNLYSTRNQFWLSVKNDEWINRLIHAPWVYPYAIAKFIAACTSMSSCKGYVQAFFGRKRMKAKRRAITSRIRVRGSAMRSWFV